MKNLKMFAIGLAAMFTAISTIFAQDVNNAESLNACIVLGGECTLAKDIKVNDNTFEGTEITAKKDVVIDLNGHTLTLNDDFSLDVMGKKITVTVKNGTVVQESAKGDVTAFNVYEGTLKTEKLTITVTSAAGTNRQGKNMPHAFFVSGTDNKSVSYLVVSADTTVTVDNGYGLVLSSHADVDLNGTWKTGKSTITDATYHDPSYAATKSTIVVINGGSYTSTSSVETDYVLDIKKGNYTINGGNFISEHKDAVHISNVTTEGAQTVKIVGGYFETKDTSHRPIYAVALTKFITGGTFKAPVVGNEIVNTYLADGIKSVVTADKSTLVGKPYKVNIGNLTVTANATETSLGYTKPASFEAIEGEKVNLLAKLALTRNVSPKDLNYRYGVKYTITNVSTKEVVTGLDEFTMPSSDVIVDLELAEVRKDAEVGEAKPTDVTPVDPSNTGSNANTPETTNPDVPNVPKTNDNILVYASLGLVSALTVGFSAKRKENN